MELRGKYERTSTLSYVFKYVIGFPSCAVGTFRRRFGEGGIRFIRYGYYDDKDRSGPPDVIYPDFLKEPHYTNAGEPFVTMMQDACPHYKGEARRADDTTCGECEYFHRGEEWFGLCHSPKNKREGQA